MAERQELVEIDLSSATTPRELQLLLLHSLNFPGFYGCNWNAFWDAITGLVEMPQRLRLIGWRKFAARLPADARMLKGCLDDALAQYPEWSAVVEYV